MQRQCTVPDEMRKISRSCPRSLEGTELGHFTLLFPRGRQRNVQNVITYVHSFCFAHYTTRTDRDLQNHEKFQTFPLSEEDVIAN